MTKNKTFAPHKTTDKCTHNELRTHKKDCKTLKYEFSSEITKRIRACYRNDNYHGIIQVLEDYGVIVICIFAPYTTSAIFNNNDVTWWLTYIFISTPIIGCRQRGLADILHQSAHKTLAKNRFLNKLLGTFFSGYLVFQSWTAYFESHVKKHHVHFGNEKIDPDYVYLIEEGLYEKKHKADWVWKNLISPLFLLKNRRKAIELFKNRLFYAKDSKELITKILYISFLTISFIYFGYGKELLLFWIVPLITAFPVVNWYIELMEHFPLVRQNNIDLYMTRNRWTGPLAKFFTGIHNEHLHLVHHLFPAIPSWHLPKAHKILTLDPNYWAVQQREIGLLWPIITGTPSIAESISGYVTLQQENGDDSF